MAKITWTNPDTGERVEGEITNAALESTAILMKSQLEAMNSSLSKVADTLLLNAVRTAKGQKLSEEQHKENLDASKRLAEGIDEMNEEDKYSAKGEKFLAGAFGAIESVTIGIANIMYSTFSIFSRALLNTGNELNELTKVGAGFTDSGGSALDAMAALSFKGVDAAKTLGQFSSVVQSIGKNTFTQLTTAFLDATDSGVQLGMSLDDSVERMGKELQKRQMMGALDGISRAALTAQIETSIKQQQKYASALGVSTEELVKFTESLITDTPIFSSALLRLGPELRSKVIAGVTDFGTAMRATGGAEGGKLVQAMTEAAAGGALGFSDALVGYVTALPSLSGPVNSYINALQSGNFSQERANQMAMDLTDQLGNLSAAERDRIFALERAGDQHAASLAKAILQFEQGASKLKKMNASFTMSEVQKGTNAFNVALSEITGMVDTFKYSFFAGLADSSGELSTVMETAKTTIVTAIGKAMYALGGTGDVFKDFSGSAKELGAKFAEVLPAIITKLAEYAAKFIEFIPKLINGLSTAIGWAKTIGIVVLGVAGVGAALATLTVAITMTALSLKGLSSIGKMFGIGSAAKGATAAGKAGGGLISGIGKSASNGMGGLAKGLNALGSPKTFLGIAALAAIAVPIYTVSKALRGFEEIKWETIGKGIVALAAFGAISTVLGLFAIPALAGAAALGAIGLALRVFPIETMVSFGESFKSVFQGIGSVVESIGGSIASIIVGVADSISSVINAVKGDQEAMMKLQTDQIKIVNEGILSLATIPSDNLFNTARGIDAIAVSMKSFANTVIGKEGGLFSDIGNWFTGDNVDGTSKFIESMNAFAAIDGEKIAFNAAAIINANRAQSGLTTTLDTNVVSARPITQKAQSAAVQPASARTAANDEPTKVSPSTGLPTNQYATLDEILEQAKITNKLLRTGNKGMIELSNAL